MKRDNKACCIKILQIIILLILAFFQIINIAKGIKGYLEFKEAYLEWMNTEIFAIVFYFIPYIVIFIILLLLMIGAKKGMDKLIKKRRENYPL